MPDDQTRLIQTLSDELSEMNEASQARAAGVSGKALLRPVKPIAEHITDLDEALLALQEAVQIAKRVQEEGHQGTNHGEFFDTVLLRVTALSGEGEHETAIPELENALAQEETQSAARQIRLVNAAVDQRPLAFDAKGAAVKIARRVQLTTPEPVAFFDALREEDDRHERDGEMGSILVLHVADASAEKILDHGDTSDQRGTALYDLGIAHQTLGRLEIGAGQLYAAVTAFRAALEERARDRAPLDWAMTQMKLGSVLQTLAERESSTHRLDEAIAA